MIMLLVVDIGSWVLASSLVRFPLSILGLLLSLMPDWHVIIHKIFYSTYTLTSCIDMEAASFSPVKSRAAQTLCGSDTMTRMTRRILLPIIGTTRPMSMIKDGRPRDEVGSVSDNSRGCPIWMSRSITFLMFDEGFLHPEPFVSFFTCHVIIWRCQPFSIRNVIRERY